MLNRLQPLFSIKLNGQDVTRDVEPGTTYDERADQVTTLTVTLKRGAYYLEVVKPGQQISMIGGTMGSPEDVRLIFTGVVKKLKGNFQDDGQVFLTIEAYDTIWGNATTNKRHNVYPQKSSPRAWADKSVIKASDIIKNITQEMNAELELQLPNGADIEYGLKRPLPQVNMSDWALLRMLAKRLGCFVWTDLQGDKLIVRFIDSTKVANYSAKTSFLYPLRDESEFVIGALKPNQMILRSVSVDEDVQAADANVRIVTKFDDASSQEISLISRQEERDGKRYIYYYQLDTEKVAALERTNPKEATRLISMGGLNIPYEEFIKYYKPYEYVEDTVAVWAQIFIGITVTATSDGNIDVRSQQAYEISGIARYSTNERIGKFYLRSLKYIWDDDGFRNEYEFMK